MIFPSQTCRNTSQLLLLHVLPPAFRLCSLYASSCWLHNTQPSPPNCTQKTPQVILHLYPHTLSQHTQTVVSRQTDTTFASFTFLFHSSSEVPSSPNTIQGSPISVLFAYSHLKYTQSQKLFGLFSHPTPRREASDTYHPSPSQLHLPARHKQRH